ncbi:MAG: sulfatase-like hydrolase/transferase [Blastocatellia bacterium]
MRTKRYLLILVLMMMVAGAASAQRRPRAADRHPNILLIIADDLAAWHTGCYGNQEIRTPNLDRLAQNGIRMKNSFVVTPICSPSRATLLTGRVPRQHGIYDYLVARPDKNPEQGQKDVPASFSQEVMLSDLLAANGYECGYVGKWHLGNEPVPQHHFTYWRVWQRVGSGPYNDPEIGRDDGSILKERGYLPEVLTRHAADFIRRRHAQPWFLVVSHFNPHTPYEGHPQRYLDLYRNVNFTTFGIEPKAPNALREAEFMNDPIPALRKAAASTTALDDQIPPLLEALERTGQRDHTLIVFVGDNGFLYGRHGAWSKGWAQNPIVMYEEVVRVPMIFNWPGVLRGGQTPEQFVSFTDVLPTLLEASATGARLPDRNLPGRSFWPMLNGRKQAWENTAYFNFRYADAIRDERYKLILRNGEGPDELFDFQRDPREKENRIDDPQLRAVKQRLRAKLEQWVRKYQ